jgi:hypothetical protein
MKLRWPDQRHNTSLDQERKMSTTSQSNHDECTKYVRGLLADEIRYRRDRQWNIFSWSSSLLLGLIGGIVALAGASENFKLTTRYCVLL